MAHSSAFILSLNKLLVQVSPLATMSLLALVSFHGWEGAAPWAFCHEVPSSNEGGGEVFLNNWAPRVHTGEKVVSLFIQYFSETTVPSPANKVFLKLAANRAAYGRISLPLYGQEDLPQT